MLQFLAVQELCRQTVSHLANFTAANPFGTRNWQIGEFP
jgi:hypothetical protein